VADLKNFKQAANKGEKMYEAIVATLEEILIKRIPARGWLYLGEKPWNLATEGIMIADDIDAPADAPFPPRIIQNCGLNEVLDAAGIEDIIDNAEAQVTHPTPDQILLAFNFYFENDAFIDFSEINS
jgi:hypothetical protein